MCKNDNHFAEDSSQTIPRRGRKEEINESDRMFELIKTIIIKSHNAFLLKEFKKTRNKAASLRVEAVEDYLEANSK